jgi:hypothetical protein
MNPKEHARLFNFYYGVLPASTQVRQSRSVAAEEAARRNAGKHKIALFKLFGIDADDVDRWRKLALSLAARHVPACGPGPHRGRPRSWTARTKQNLVKTYQQLKRDYPEMRERELAAELKKKMKPLLDDRSPETVRRLVALMKRKTPKLC